MPFHRGTTELHFAAFFIFALRASFEWNSVRCVCGPPQFSLGNCCKGLQ